MALRFINDKKDRGIKENDMGDNLLAINLGSERRASKVALGKFHTCVLLDNAEIKCWGKNENGRLGYTDAKDRGGNVNEMDVLPAVQLGGKATHIAVNTHHSCAILESGDVKCWGSNNYGELGLGNTIAKGDQPGQMGTSLNKVNLGKNKTAIDINLGFSHTCAILNDRQVKCWGRNHHGQLGLGDKQDRGNNESSFPLPTVNLNAPDGSDKITLGGYHSCVLLNTGYAKCWGFNSHGQLGNGTALDVGIKEREMGRSLKEIDF